MSGVRDVPVESAIVVAPAKPGARPPVAKRRDIAPTYEDQETLIRRVVRQELAPLHQLLAELHASVKPPDAPG